MTATVPLALAGAADTAAFLARRPQLFSEARGRALGSAAFGGLWVALAARAAADGTRSSTASLGLAATVAAGSAAMLAVHLRHQVASPRVFLGAALGAGALADVIRRR